MVTATAFTSAQSRRGGAACRAAAGRPGRLPDHSRLSCLVVTTARADRDRVRLALAGDSRYTCVAPASRAELAAASDHDHELVFVDLPTLFGGWLADGLAIVHARAGRRATLVAVCGHEDDCDEELVLRQLGVGLYLPGVRLGDAVNHVVEALER